jgi:antitoxin component of RelBE/YafQ-DinJ toxin-antitoxin module
MKGDDHMDNKKTKSQYVHVRIEEGFKDNVVSKAKEYGLTLSTLVNMLLHEWYNDKLAKDK